MVVYQILSPKKRTSFFERLSLTTWIIIANVFLFIVFSLLVGYGILGWDSIALKPSNVFLGKYLWTFITSMFMHAGFFHIFVNMLSLFFVGSLLEKILGKRRYFWFYVFSGVFAGVIFVLASQIFPSDFNTYAVGASGAIFGLIGVLMFLTPNLPVYLMFIPIPIKMKYAAPGMLVVLWLISIGGDVPIGNTAHLGGFIAGLIYGFFLKRKYPNKVGMISKRFSR